MMPANQEMAVYCFDTLVAHYNGEQVPPQEFEEGHQYLRRRCCEDCTLAPFFPATNPMRFAYVHRVFGASNVARMLQQIPAEQRRQAADAIALEAYWRMEDPVYGSVGVISRLQREINAAQRELAETQAHIALYAARSQSPTTQFDPSITDN